MRISVALAAVVAVGLAGCAQTVWLKDGATKQDFNSDAYACERDARMSNYFGGGLIAQINFQEFQERCMVAHGWMKRGG
jgi:hypothetical protein